MKGTGNELLRKESEQPSTVRRWAPLQFIIDMVHATRKLLKDVIKSRKWVFIYRKEKTKEKSSTYIEIHYND
ncbi:MAG: hypothetical protein QM731_19110 [Chitinophagaceae bacterium]